MFLLFNKSISFIISKLNEFGYNITEEEVGSIFSELKNSLPPSLSDLINNNGILNIADETHVQWLKQFGIFEYYDFILRRESEKNPPEYFKWCADCLWVHSYKDVMCLINILLFNGESLENISSIVSFNYKKKLGMDTLDLYKNIFWDCSCISSKDALYYCTPFRNNALIIRKLRSGESEVMMNDDSHDGIDIPVTLHDNNYIKWKIGYKDVVVPDAKCFIDQIKKDSYYKYYEAMNMSQSVETETEDGSNDKIGAFTRSLKRCKNVEEQRVKMAKNWFDIYLKANEAIPEVNKKASDDFFEKMQQLELDFSTGEDDKIARIEDVPDILNDIKKDMSP